MTTIYQTVKDSENPDKIEQDGPILCTANDAWLGVGYYYWESYINNAHWWGKTHIREQYVICQSHYQKDDYCFDLIDNPEHMSILSQAINEMRKEGLYIEGKTTVARLIEFLRGINVFHFKSTRAYAIGCRSAKSEYENRVMFSEKNKAYLEVEPLFQVCFYSKCSITDYYIVYPDCYVAGYLA